jgi:hypothetical protein
MATLFLLFFGLFHIRINVELWTGYEPCHKAATYKRQEKAQKKRRQTPMPGVGFEPTIPVFERAKTFHALESAAAVNCNFCFHLCNYPSPVVEHDGTHSRRAVT